MIRSFSGKDRAWIRRAMSVHEVDVLIVGGGINGCGLARDLALRGARVALVEKNDFAAGTSSRSSRLLHGGLRYLEEAYKLIPRPSAIRQIALVFESVTERWRMSRLARHLARPLPFVFPALQGGRVSLAEVKLGVSLYDALALGRNLPHRSLERADVLHQLPTFDGARLKGGVLYYDYRTNDARMTLENAISAHELGALVLSRARVTAPIVERTAGKKRLAGAIVHDDLAGESFHVRAKVIVSATGPWTDEALRALDLEKPSDHPQVRPTKGVHIVVPREKLPLRSAAALTHPTDGRVLFALPFDERSVLGTTDTDWTGSPDSVRVERADVDYLLEA
ncbi:MAG TPA: glycerol-3-phosphate dehydrogenase/oxidase, partial [bacterium]|nr:glycerol-3-phosphate dehydrogenase/oxidase [bacterium]